MSEVAYANTNRELWRAPKGDLPSDYYAPSVYVTEGGRIGFSVGGYCVERTPREWLDMAWPACRECETRALHPPWCSVGHRHTRRTSSQEGRQHGS